ncbi:hypothetical protein NL108_018326 [Boleophthalmus pectinirostris]|nr:hypothetical protein NL108_018326 [Boleophthalmus pectinirostris]
MVKLDNMECPAQCPDLNPIELDRRVKVKQPTSATHLRELQQQTWEELPEEYLISVVKRTSHECVQLLHHESKVYNTFWSTVNGKKLEKVWCSKTFDRLRFPDFQNKKL